MSVCLRCNKKGTLFHPLHLIDGLCPECDEIMRAEREAEAKRRREETARQRAADEARMERRRAEAEEANRKRLEEIERQRLEKLKKPFTPPDALNGFVLTHSYPDVGIFVPDEMMEAAKTVPLHKQLTFYFDPDNAYDPDTVGISYEGKHIGYMNKGKLRDWITETADDDDQEALGVSVYWDETPIIGLYFYLSAARYAERMKKRDGFKKITLAGNSGAEMQDNILLCHPGESVDIDYDPDRERYVAVSSGGEIGLFPASAEDYLTNHTSFEARIFEITERDSGKMAVSLMIAPGDT